MSYSCDHHSQDFALRIAALCRHIAKSTLVSFSGKWGEYSAAWRKMCESGVCWHVACKLKASLSRSIQQLPVYCFMSSHVMSGMMNIPVSTRRIWRCLIGNTITSVHQNKPWSSISRERRNHKDVTNPRLLNAMGLEISTLFCCFTVQCGIIVVIFTTSWYQYDFLLRYSRSFGTWTTWTTWITWMSRSLYKDDLTRTKLFVNQNGYVPLDNLGNVDQNFLV